MRCFIVSVYCKAFKIILFVIKRCNAFLMYCSKSHDALDHFHGSPVGNTALVHGHGELNNNKNGRKLFTQM